MYRLTIHRTGPGTVRITHKATGFTYDLHAPTQRDLVSQLRLVMLDIAGHQGQSVRHNLRSIKRSIKSAVRRMR